MDFNSFKNDPLKEASVICRDRSEWKEVVTTPGCSKCNFRSEFSAPLVMHRQLYHNTDDKVSHESKSQKNPTLLMQNDQRNKIELKEASRTNSVNGLFDKFRAKICRSKPTLSIYNEGDSNLNVNRTTNTFKEEIASKSVKNDVLNNIDSSKECYRCHLCSFVADRITVLDRHLLNEHKIGLDNLLKLVMAKTKDGVTDELEINKHVKAEPYYKKQNNVELEGEFVVETVTPKIKILRHASTNTDLNFADMPDLKDGFNCKQVKKELDKLMSTPLDNWNRDELFSKMLNLSECMSRFVDSTNALSKVLTKDIDSRCIMNMSLKNNTNADMGIGDSRESNREWKASHSQSSKTESHKSGNEKSKTVSSRYFY